MDTQITSEKSAATSVIDEQIAHCFNRTYDFEPLRIFINAHNFRQSFETGPEGLASELHCVGLEFLANIEENQAATIWSDLPAARLMFDLADVFYRIAVTKSASRPHPVATGEVFEQ